MTIKEYSNTRKFELLTTLAGVSIGRNNAVMHALTYFYRKYVQYLKLKSVRKGAVVSSIKLTNQLVIILTGVILARYLGPANYGTYSFTMAIIGILVLFSQLGFKTLSVREISIYASMSDLDMLRGYLLYAFVFSSVLSIILTLLSYMYFTRLSPASEINIISFGLLLIPITTTFGLVQSFLNGFQSIIQTQLVIFFRLILLTLFCLFTVIISHHTFDSTIALKFQGLSTALALILAIFLLTKNVPIEFFKSTNVKVSNNWLTGAITFTMLSTMQFLNTRTDIVMLGLFKSSTEVGVYRVASLAIGLTAFSLQVIVLLMAPKIASMYANNKTEKLQRIVTISARFIFVTTIVFLLLLLAFSAELLTLVFGVDFLPASTPMYILGMGKMFASFASCAPIILSMCGFERITARILIYSVIFNILLNLVLVPTYGTVGAAISTAIVVIGTSYTLYYQAKLKLNINPSAFCTLK